MNAIKCLPSASAKILNLLTALTIHGKQRGPYTCRNLSCSLKCKIGLTCSAALK